jgi:16S rRNA (uracil1498-N3)-methyltransferase
VNLILVSPAEIESGAVRLTDNRGAHLATVLKAAPGHRVRIGLVDGPLGTGTVTAVDAAGVSLMCEFEAAAPPRPRVDLLLALPRPKVLRRLWSQVAALGVGQVMLTNAARVERDYFGTHVLAPSAYTPLLVEGLQQARDTRLPIVTVHRRFKVLVEDDLERLFPAGVRVAAQPGRDESFTGLLTRPQAPGPGHQDEEHRDDMRVLLAIGPEGGWTEFELALLERHGFRTASLGQRTLRSDTATIALLTLAHHELASRNAFTTND